MTITQLARVAGVPTTTLRYYERAKLLLPTERGVSNYRLYGQRALERLRFIRLSQAAGFALSDISALLQLRDADGGRGCQMEVRALLEKRLADTDKRLTDLKRVRTALASALDRCRTSDNECAVMKDLDAGLPPKRRKKA